jgi:hypothetical protein
MVATSQLRKIHTSNFDFFHRPVLMLNLMALWMNLAFPKAGFYIGSVPVTLGYVALGLGSFGVVLKLLLREYSLSRAEWVAILLLLGNALFQVLTVFFRGSSTETSMLFGHLTSLSVIPPLALLSGGYILRQVSRERVYHLMFWALVIVIVFGFINFIGLNVFKKMIGIPFLTFTGSEFDVSTKFIDRGNAIKLISTYNNGNIFGVNLLIWCNLVLYGFPVILKKSRKWFFPFLGIFVRAVLLLTLSRTVWIVMVFNEVFLRVFVSRKVNQALILVFVLTLLLILVFVAAGFFAQNPLDFIFDSNLGARRSQLDFSWSLWPNQAFAGTAEIVYAGMLSNFGAFGLGLFVLTWAWPALIVPIDFEGRLVQMGLFAYLLALGADGAFIYAPTQATYWFVVAFVLHRTQAGVMAGSGSNIELNLSKKF